MDGYEKADRKYPISIKMRTGDVPDDGKYHVIDSGEIVLSTAVLDYALMVFQELRENHRIAAGDPDPKELRRNEQAHKELRALRGEGVSQRERRNRGGGRGGRGGV